MLSSSSISEDDGDCIYLKTICKNFPFWVRMLLCTCGMRQYKHSYKTLTEYIWDAKADGRPTPDHKFFMNSVLINLKHALASKWIAWAISELQYKFNCSNHLSIRQVLF